MNYKSRLVTNRFSSVKIALTALIIFFNTSTFGGDTENTCAKADCEDKNTASQKNQKTEPVPQHTVDIYPIVSTINSPSAGSHEPQNPGQITIQESHRYFPLINSVSQQPELVEVSDPGQIPVGSGEGLNNFYSYSVNTYRVSVGAHPFSYMVAGTNGYRTLRYALPDDIRASRNQYIETQVSILDSTYQQHLPRRPSDLPEGATLPEIDDAIDRIIQPDENGNLPSELTQFSNDVFRSLHREFLDSLEEDDRARIDSLQGISYEQRAETLVNIIREQRIDLLLIIRTRPDEYQAIINVLTRNGFDPQTLVATQGDQAHHSNDEVIASENTSIISSAFIQLNRNTASHSVSAQAVDLHALGISSVSGYGNNLNNLAAVDVNAGPEQIRLISALTPPLPGDRTRVMNDIRNIIEVTAAKSLCLIPFYSFKSDSYKEETEAFRHFARFLNKSHPVIFLRDQTGGELPYNADSQEAKLLKNILRKLWNRPASFDDPYSIKPRNPGDDNDRNGPGLGGAMGIGSKL